MLKLTKLPRCHWNIQRGRKVKAKRAFDSDYKAGEYIIKHNLVGKYSFYKCEVCGKWHIGHIKEN